MNIVAVAVTDYIGIILLIALLINSRFKRVDQQLDMKIFSNIAFLTLISCFVDFISFYADGNPGNAWRIINIMANSFCFFANPVFVFSWCLYEDYKLYHSIYRLRKIYNLASIPAVIMIILVFVNLFYPIIFYVTEDNVYHRLPLSYVYYLIDTVYLLFSYIVIAKYEKKYGKVRFFPLYLFLGPITLGCALQLIFFGVSLIWVSLAVGITAIYMSIQNESAYLDTLTGLYNRAYLYYKLDFTGKFKDPKLGGIMVDVDYFKQINDTYGHSTGDKALTDVAKILNNNKPDNATAIRFAGDEFILLAYDTSIEELENIKIRMTRAVEFFNSQNRRPYKLSLSMGCSTYDSENESLDAFLKHMDNNMYEAKRIRHEELEKRS
ncbi:GGDEF domain-containing protein [Butyrivibrio sp. XPD2002]|uniref:GGDEF domain-containing protein n=2 Tax=unclassified Butyrivibrio TaxID=2639466 RepID=UPI0003F9E194|nr:GGDEF domain-containing protein [Butyrivibrio sp. XPD2002]